MRRAEGPMDVDLRRQGWPQRAACRWVAYFILWTITVGVCLFSSVHVVVAVAGALLGCALAASLPLMFATLFETSYGRRTRGDLPLICCPWLGSAVVLLGAFILLQASSFVVAEFSHITVDSARTLCSRFAGLPLSKLPRTVCIRRAFVKTDWEAGKLRCEADQGGRVVCRSAFAAAPIFDDKELAGDGLAEEIWAWAITRGRHVDANYRPDGSLCGYLTGTDDFEFFIGDFRLAVQHVVEKHKLQLKQVVTEEAPSSTLSEEGGIGGGSSSGLGGEGSEVTKAPMGLSSPLEARPLFLAADPEEVTSVEKALLLAAFILLFFCPCVGPIPLGFIFAFWCWARNDRYGGRHVVTPDEDEDDFKGAY